MYRKGAKADGTFNSRTNKSIHWKPEMAEMTYKLALTGYTDKMIADFFGLKVDVINYWKLHNMEFRTALYRGKEEADMAVAKSLFRRAVGYTYTEKLEITNLNGVVTRTETTTKHVPGDVGACKFWLTMRQREQWAEINRTDVNVKFSGNIDITSISEQLQDRSKFSDAELELALKLGLAAIPQNASDN